MAGSYLHVTNPDGSFRGVDLLDGMRDAYPAIEQMHQMIAWMASQLEPADPRFAIWEAWYEGYLRPLHNGNEYLPHVSGFEAFWADD